MQPNPKILRLYARVGRWPLLIAAFDDGTYWSYGSGAFSKTHRISPQREGRSVSLDDYSSNDCYIIPVTRLHMLLANISYPKVTFTL